RSFRPSFPTPSNDRSPSDPTTINSSRLAAVSLALELFERGAESGVVFELPVDLVAGVDDGRVVAAAEPLADRRERPTRQLPRQVHADHAWKRDVARALFGQQIVQPDAVVVADDLLDRVDADRGAVAEQVVEDLPREIDRDRRLRERGERRQPGEAALELADVGVDLRGEVDRDL